MEQKEVENPLLISNFEINKKNNTVVLYVNPKIFPIYIINKTASLFKENAWVVVDANEDEILVELKPKINIDLELLARQFNNELLNQTTKEIKVDVKSDALLSKIKAVVSQFIKEEQGKISKQSILAIGTILATLGLAEIANATHACASDFSGGGDGDGEGGECEGEGGEGDCG